MLEQIIRLLFEQEPMLSERADKANAAFDAALVGLDTRQRDAVEAAGVQYAGVYEEDGFSRGFLLGMKLAVAVILGERKGDAA